MSRRLAVMAAGAGLSAAAFPSTALAHGLSGRADLPVPPWLFAWAAGLVLALSFVALGALWPTPQLQRPRLRPLVRIPVAVDVAAGLVGVALFVLVIYSGLAGSRVATANLAPTAIYVVFWVGLPVASALFGDVFRALNPWLAVARGVAWASRALTRRPPPAPLAYPSWLGHWPAVVGVLGFAWLELAYVNKDDPGTLAVLALGYAVVQWLGMGLFGIERWTERGDAFAVLFGLYGRLAPLVRKDGWLCVRPPLSGAPGLVILPGTVALLCAAIGTTAFDGFSSGPLWTSLAARLQDGLRGLGASPETALELASAAGILAWVAIVALVLRVGAAGMARVGEGRDARELAGRFAHGLIPIALAYVVAHYFSLLVFGGQAVRYLVSDPLGEGTDIFGTARAQIDYGVISGSTIWYVQVGALIAGHVAGLALGHDRALALYSDAREAVRSQYWMLLVMVGFTSLGLWLLSAVNTS